MGLPDKGHWTTDTDVVICGGGFAGLLLARQLRRERPGARVVVIDRLSRPLPEAAFKVGESTVELASHYLRDVLGLGEYLQQEHLRKLGLRFFFTEGNNTDMAARPEFGLSDFAPVTSYQIDRGKFENDLRGIIEEDGAQLLEGCCVVNVALGTDGAPHRVTYRRGDEEPRSLTARWVVDASGRKQMLQRQLGLVRRRTSAHSAAWFRVDGKLDIDDLVPVGNAAWHARVPGGKRRLSTNHFIGLGYWVWVIPLSSDKASVGIVADETYHPLSTFQTRARAKEWLQTHEPALAAHLGGFTWLDFSAIKNYSHTSSKVFSHDRWACTGDSGVFADPMYSPGADLIGFANCCISHLIGRDMAGELTEDEVQEKSRFLISLCELLTRSIQVNYHLLGCAPAMGGKLFWDITAGFAVVHTLMFGRSFLDGETHAAVRRIGKAFFSLSLQINQMFLDWAKRSQGNIGFDFIDYFKLQALYDMRLRNLQPGKPVADLLHDQELNMELMEDLALALFRLAVADVCPEELPRIEGKWLKASAIGLDPSKWDERGLFQPKSAPRDLGYLTDTLGAMFHCPQAQMAAPATAV